MPGSLLKKNARKLIFDNALNVLLFSLLYISLTSAVSRSAVRLSGIISFDEINSRLAAGELPGFSIIFSNFSFFWIFLGITMFLIQPLFDMGFLNYCLKTKREEKTSIRNFLAGFFLFRKVISIFLITSLYIILWSILLLIPGIVASYRYRQAYYILIDDPQKSALQCISESRLMMNGKKLDLLTIDISFLGWFALDLLLFLVTPLPFAIPVVSLWLSPYLGLTRAAFYDNTVSNVAV